MKSPQYLHSRRRRPAAVAIALAASLVLAGCSSGSGGANTTGGSSPSSAAAATSGAASSGTAGSGAPTSAAGGSPSAISGSPSATAASNPAGVTSSEQSATSAAAGTSTPPAAPASGTVTLVTHDSFAVDKTTLQDFEKTSGITVKLLAQGDVGAMVSKLILTKDNPLGDAVFGIDNTFASKALDAGLLVPYTSPAAAKGSESYDIDPQHRLTAIDYGDVCVNVDHRYFASKKLAEPKTFEDLAKPAYRNMLVVESPETSSPGLAFLLGTVAHFGQDWQNYWKSLRGNGVKVDSGWTDAYSVDFSGSTGKGAYPLVVSYASSPPDEVTAGMTSAPTGALLDTCFRQIEYAGVLAGAKNPAAAQKVIDFLLSTRFQSQVPGQMYVYPVDSGISLPADWQQYAPVAPHPETLSPAVIAANRDTWTGQWADLMGG